MKLWQPNNKCKCQTSDVSGNICESNSLTECVAVFKEGVCKAIVLSVGNDTSLNATLNKAVGEVAHNSLIPKSVHIRR
jgi:hypothetical protein